MENSETTSRSSVMVAEPKWKKKPQQPKSQRVVCVCVYVQNAFWLSHGSIIAFAATKVMLVAEAFWEVCRITGIYERSFIASVGRTRRVHFEGKNVARPQFHRSWGLGSPAESRAERWFYHLYISIPTIERCQLRAKLFSALAVPVWECVCVNCTETGTNNAREKH